MTIVVDLGRKATKQTKTYRNIIVGNEFEEKEHVDCFAYCILSFIASARQNII